MQRRSLIQAALATAALPGAVLAASPAKPIFKVVGRLGVDLRILDVDNVDLESLQGVLAGRGFKGCSHFMERHRYVAAPFYVPAWSVENPLTTGETESLNRVHQERIEAYITSPGFNWENETGRFGLALEKHPALPDFTGYDTPERQCWIGNLRRGPDTAYANYYYFDELSPFPTLQSFRGEVARFTTEERAILDREFQRRVEEHGASGEADFEKKLAFPVIEDRKVRIGMYQKGDKRYCFTELTPYPENDNYPKIRAMKARIAAGEFV